MCELECDYKIGYARGAPAAVQVMPAMIGHNMSARSCYLQPFTPSIFYAGLRPRRAAARPQQRSYWMLGIVPPQDLHGSRRQPYDSLTGLPLHDRSRVRPCDTRPIERKKFSRSRARVEKHLKPIFEQWIADSRFHR